MALTSLAGSTSDRHGAADKLEEILSPDRLVEQRLDFELQVRVTVALSRQKRRSILRGPRARGFVERLDSLPALRASSSSPRQRAVILALRTLTVELTRKRAAFQVTATSAGERYRKTEDYSQPSCLYAPSKLA